MIPGAIVGQGARRRYLWAAAGAHRGRRILRPLPVVARAGTGQGAAARASGRAVGERGAPWAGRAASAPRQAHRVMDTATAEVAPSASVIVIDPSGHRSRVDLAPLPFKIGRQADNDL